MTNNPHNIRPREESLKNKWEGINDRTTVNNQQFSFATTKQESKFIESQFLSDAEKTAYSNYRNEWYRRAKEFDPGDFPLAICCELVSTCNLGCTMCYTITEEFQDSVIGATRMLPWHVVKSVIDEAASLGVPSMLFSWRGESTMYRQRDADGNIITFTDVLAYARKRGILEITSLTHGQLIDDVMAEKIVDAEPSWISFSVDGLYEAYNKIRTPRNKVGSDYNAFEVVTDNIKRLVKIRDSKGKSRPQIRVNTIFPPISEDPDSYRAYMESIGVNWVTVNEILDFRGDELPDDAIIDQWACQYPFQRLTVSANGILLPCTGAHNEEDGLVLGRYEGSPIKAVRNNDGKVILKKEAETNLYKAWHSKKLNKIRKMHKENRRTEIEPGCRNCRHGAEKNGVDFVPEEWNMETMEWEGRIWRE